MSSEFPGRPPIAPRTNLLIRTPTFEGDLEDFDSLSNDKYFQLEKTEDGEEEEENLFSKSTELKGIDSVVSDKCDSITSFSEVTDVDRNTFCSEPISELERSRENEFDKSINMMSENLSKFLSTEPVTNSLEALKSAAEYGDILAQWRLRRRLEKIQCSGDVCNTSTTLLPLSKFCLCQQEPQRKPVKTSSLPLIKPLTVYGLINPFNSEGFSETKDNMSTHAVGKQTIVMKEVSVQCSFRSYEESRLISQKKSVNIQTNAGCFLMPFNKSIGIQSATSQISSKTQTETFLKSSRNQTTQIIVSGEVNSFNQMKNQSSAYTSIAKVGMDLKSDAKVQTQKSKANIPATCTSDNKHEIHIHFEQLTNPLKEHWAINKLIPNKSTKISADYLPCINSCFTYACFAQPCSTNSLPVEKVIDNYFNPHDETIICQTISDTDFSRDPILVELTSLRNSCFQKIRLVNDMLLKKQACLNL